MDEDQKKMAEELLFSEKGGVGFAKSLFFGRFEASQVFPFPEPSKEEEAETKSFLSRVEAFAQHNINAKQIDKEAHIPDAIIEGLSNLGVMGMVASKEYGGLGMSQKAYCYLSERLAMHCSSTALFVNVHQSIGVKAIVLFGTEEQKKKWLPLMAKGEAFGAFALTEENAGSDASNVETTAVYDPEKDVFRLNGRKQWITNGALAKVMTVMAQTDVDTPQGMQKKITAFLVTPDMPGFEVVEPALDKVGMRGTKTAILRFNDVEVPADNILGPPGGGLRVALTILDYGRTTFGATCTGAAKLLFERAVAHAKSRVQFKRQLAAFPLVKKKIAKLAAFTYAMDATTYLTAGMIDREVEDIMLEAAILKVFSSEALWDMIYDTMQIYGGRSLFTDEPFERIMRDARLNMIGEGANEVLYAFIGLVGLRDVGMQLKEVTEALQSPMSKSQTLFNFFGETLGRFVAPTVPVKSDQLKKEAKMLGKAVRKFGFVAIRTLGWYREDVVDAQFALERIAAGVIALYTVSAVLSKADAEIQKGNTKNVATAKFYCRYALKRAHRRLKGLTHNDDYAYEALSDQITEIKEE